MVVQSLPYTKRAADLIKTRNYKELLPLHEQWYLSQVVYQHW